MRYILSLCLLFSGLSAVYSQVGTLFNSDRQLSSSFVHQVYQDDNGVIWISTENGLNMYDGYSFRVIGPEHGLMSNNVNCVVADSNLMLYVGTLNGLFYWNRNHFERVYKLDTKQDFYSFVFSFATAPNKDIYVSTSGAGIWKITELGKAKRVFTSVKGLDFSRTMAFDKKGFLWVTTDNNGVYCLRLSNNEDGGSLVKHYNPKPGGTFPVCCCDLYNNVFVGYADGGLFKIGPERQEFQLNPATVSLPITYLLPSRDSRLFVGTDGFGLRVCDINTGDIRMGNLYSNELEMDRTKVHNIFEDREHNLWLCLFQNGVYMHQPMSSSFHYLGYRMGGNSPIGKSCVMALTKARDGMLYVATDHDGIYALRNNEQLVRHYEPNSKGGVPSTVLSMAEGADGRLWLGSYTEGFGWFDTASGTYHRAPFSYGKSQSVFDVRTDFKGRLWIGTLGDGLKCYDPTTDKLTEYRVGDKNCLLVNDYIVQMALSSDKRQLFVGTAAGISWLDISTGKWHKLSKGEDVFAGEYINAISCHPKRGLWIGTRNGVFNIDLKTLEMKKYTTNEGLPSNNVSSIEYDQESNIWVSTYRGICRIANNPSDIDCYFFSDGLQGNEFCDGASFCDPDGMLFFGGVSGLTFFQSKNMEAVNRKLNVLLIGMTVGGTRVEEGLESGSYIMCNTALPLASRFDFCHEDNSITMSFSTMNYSGVERIRYSYSINGEDWVMLPPGENELILSRMQPGDYKIQVVAIDNNVKSPVKEFTIVIHNAWYFTPFARIIYFLLFAFAMGWLFFELKKRNIQRLELQEHIHAEELNDQKIRFFINMSHEIRTPMTLIISPLQQLLNEDRDPLRHARYTTMRRNAERILHLVNQIMDIRKIDKGQMGVQMRETNMVDFIREIVTTFQPTADSKHINLSFLTATDNLPVWIDRSHFDKIMMNVMSNAFKYTPTGGEVRLSLSSNATTMTLVVFDDGEKIPEENLETIFQRFNQGKSISNQHNTGTGVGLDLTRSLVQMHHGEIIARNVADGVEFVITIPLGKEHLREDEIANWSEEEEQRMVSASSVPVITMDDMTEEVADNDVEGSADAAVVASSKRPTIAVVEDDDEIRNYLMAELSATYRVITYPDGEEALKGILREIPQLVISDIMMPRMDGTVLCSKLKSNVNTNHVPVILLTAKSGDDDRLEGLETGADLYVTKPFNMDILRRSIANLLGSRRVMENKFSGQEDQRDKIDEVELESIDEKLLNRIMGVINDNLNNSDLNIEMICSEVGISRVHLHRKMKELTNQTPHDFIRNLRLKQAARLLSRKGQSITEVMYRCGFNSATSFSTMFKKMYGVSPRQYQKDHEG